MTPSVEIDAQVAQDLPAPGKVSPRGVPCSATF